MLLRILRSLKNRGTFPFKQTDIEVVLLGFLGVLVFFNLMFQLLLPKKIEVLISWHLPSLLKKICFIWRCQEELLEHIHHLALLTPNCCFYKCRCLKMQVLNNQKNKPDAFMVLDVYRHSLFLIRLSVLSCLRLRICSIKSSLSLLLESYFVSSQKLKTKCLPEEKRHTHTQKSHF